MLEGWLLLLLAAGLIGPRAYAGGLLGSSETLACEVSRLFGGTGEPCAVTGNQVSVAASQVRFDDGLARRPPASGREALGLGPAGVGRGDVVVETELGLTGTADALSYGQVSPLEGSAQWKWTPPPRVPPPPPSSGGGWWGRWKRAAMPALAAAIVWGPEGDAEGVVHEEWLEDGSHVVVLRGEDPEVIVVERCATFSLGVCWGDHAHVFGRLRDGVYETETGEIVARETEEGWETYFPMSALSGSPTDYTIRVVKEQHGDVEVLVPRFFDRETGRVARVLFWEGTPVHLDGAEYALGSDEVRRARVTANEETFVVRVLPDGTLDLKPLLDAGLCFVAGTQVHTPLGLRAIETIAVGDEVWAKEPGSGEVSLKRVSQTFRREGREVLSLTVRGVGGKQETFGVTPSHPFWVEGLGWVEAGGLSPGNLLGSRGGAWLSVVAVKREVDRATVYNFEVEDTHTYFVGEAGAWVHNECSELVIPPLDIEPAHLPDVALQALLAAPYNESVSEIFRRTSSTHIARQLGPILDRLGIEYSLVTRGRAYARTTGIRLVNVPGLNPHLDWSRAHVVVDSQALARRDDNVYVAEVQGAGASSEVVISPALLSVLLRGETDNNFLPALAAAQARQILADHTPGDTWSPYTLEVEAGPIDTMPTYSFAEFLVDARLAQRHGGRRGLAHSNRALDTMERILPFAAMARASHHPSVGYPVHPESMRPGFRRQLVDGTPVMAYEHRDPLRPFERYRVRLPELRPGETAFDPIDRMYRPLATQFGAAAQRNVQLAYPELFGDLSPGDPTLDGSSFSPSPQAVFDLIGRSLPGRPYITADRRVRELWAPGGYLIHLHRDSRAAASHERVDQTSRRFRRRRFEGDTVLPQVPTSVAVGGDPRVVVTLVPPDAYFVRVPVLPRSIRSRVDEVRAAVKDAGVLFDAQDLMYSPSNDQIYIIRPGMRGVPPPARPPPEFDPAA